MERLGGLSRLMPWTSACFLIGGVAISALPPLNGFASEFVIYSGLFWGTSSGVWAQLALCVTGALLAFVGAVSTLSITRAFGVVFLGTPRDASVPRGKEVSRWMLVPMGIHVTGVIVLGIIPAAGFMLVRGPTELAMGPLSASAAAIFPPILHTLTRIGLISGALVASIALVVWLRSKAASNPAVTHVTWGCGYGATNSRMQYTGASFSADFAAHFRGLMVLLRRKKSPIGYFPSDSYVITDCVDAVERRLFSVIGRGDASAANMSAKLREDDPRIAFAAGLVAVVIIGGLVLLWGGALR
jgi:hydrogenase-4 component B